MTPADIALAESLVELAVRATAAVRQLRTDKPEVYAAISEHHKAAMGAAEAELAKK